MARIAPFRGVFYNQKKIKDLLSHRSPFYAQADAIVDTTARSVEETVSEILKVLHGNHSG